jgi:tetratricopeptide (TPR) repeat protein
MKKEKVKRRKEKGKRRSGTLPDRTGRVVASGCLSLVCVVALLAADLPRNLLNRGNEALANGQPEIAQQLYSAASERAEDPGQVSFNQGIAHAHQGNYREAELCFLRALDDRESPPDRRAKALYNRAVCLLNRDTRAETYRTAIACLNACLALEPSEGTLKADAQHNLELAKLLWGRARTQERTPPKASDPPPEAIPQQPPEAKDSDPGAEDQGNSGTPRGTPKPVGVEANRGQNPLETDQTAPGTGPLPVQLDAEDPRPVSPYDALRHLETIAERLRNDRRKNLELLSKPEPRHVPNW